MTAEDFDAADSAICDDWDGKRNWACDHSDAKYLGIETYGVNCDSSDWRLLH
jgi:hypothetical protein